MSNKPRLGYWGIRGIAHPIRQALFYAGVDFENVMYGDANAWFPLKPTLDLPFGGNLPYYIDGDIKIVQSGAILRYIAEKYNLGGETTEEKVRVSMADYHVLDLRTALKRAFTSPDIKEGVKEFFNMAHESFKKFSVFMGNNKYLAGDKVTYVDFMIYEVICMLEEMKAPFYSSPEFASMRSLKARIEDLPSFKKLNKTYPDIGFGDLLGKLFEARD